MRTKTTNERDVEPKHDEIARRAREIWENAGCQSGRDLEFWLQAERELLSSKQAPLNARASTKGAIHILSSQ